MPSKKKPCRKKQGKTLKGPYKWGNKPNSTKDTNGRPRKKK